jgi:hypothetical protein
MKKTWIAPKLETLDVEKTLTGPFQNLPEGFIGQPGNVVLGGGPAS